MRDCTFSSASAAASIVFGIGVRGHAHHRHQLAVDLHRNLDLVFLRQFRIALRPRRAQHSALLAQLLPQLRRKKRRKRRQQQHQRAQQLAHHGAGTSPAASCASAACISFTSSIIAATQVLKCQRPSKSSVILAIVWCSLRSSFSCRRRSAPSFRVLRLRSATRHRRVLRHQPPYAGQKAAHAATPSSCQSRSRSGGAANSAYMRAASAP